MIHRGIVVVHGVGNQQRGDQLEDVIEPLVQYLSVRAIGYAHVHVVARIPRSGNRGASARIHLYAPGSPPGDAAIEEWDVREAWWAHVFRASGGAAILAWAIRALIAHVRSTVHNILLRNLRRAVGRPPKVQGAGIWQVPVAGAYIYYVLDALNWLLITLGYLLVYAIGSVLALVLYVFLLLPGLQFWPPAGSLQRSILDIFTGGIGEQQATTNRQIAVAEAASVVTEALRPFLDYRAIESGVAEYDSVTVIAHSGGCVVSFEALASEAVRRWLAQGAGGRRFLTLITLGSGLNLAWRMRAKRQAKDIAFWNRPIADHVNWINIYARYDPVPQGQPPDGLVRTLTGADVKEQPWLAVRVANDDSPLTDHGAYWQNDEEVNARLVHAIVDSRLARQPLAELGGSADPAGRRPLLFEDAVFRDVLACAPRHRESVTRRCSARIGAAGGTILLLALLHALVSRLGSHLLTVTGWTWPSSGLPGWLAANTPLGWLVRPPVGDWLLGAVLSVYAAVILLLLAQLAASIVAWFQPKPDAPWPPDAGKCP